MKKLLIITALATTSIVAQAELNLNFNDIDTISEIKKGTKTKGSVEIIDQKLHLDSPKSKISIPTGKLPKKNYSLNFDWQYSGGTGLITRLSDHNPNKRLFSLLLLKGKVTAESYLGKKYKKKPLFKAKSKTWYNFDIKIKNGTYTTVIKEKDGDVVYSSIKNKKKLRFNKSITPKLLVMTTWEQKKEGRSFDYDNIVLNK